MTSNQECTDDIFSLSVPLRRGSAKMEREGRVVYDGDVRPGMIRVLTPGERVRVTRRSPGRRAVFKISGRRFRNLADECGYKLTPGASTFIDPILQPNDHVQRLCNSLSFASEIDPNNRALFFEGIALALVSIVLRPTQRDALKGGKHSGGLTDAQFSRCVDFAHNNIAERLDVASWAAAIDMSASEFGRRFYRRTKVSPYSWFLSWRIEQGKQLLTARNLSLAEVALEVGFSSQSHFTEAFTKRLGISPGRWRLSAECLDPDKA